MEAAWSAFSNWFFPVNVNWFWLFIIASGILAVVAWVWTAVNSSSEVYVDGFKKVVKHRFGTFVRSVISLTVTLVTISFLVWCIYANNMPAEMASEERLEIKPVTFPNGKVVQMFHCEGTNYNANEMYGCTPPEGSYVRRLIYKRVYAGVYFPGRSERLKDTYSLVWPDKTEKKADLVPGQ